MRETVKIQSLEGNEKESADLSTGRAGAEADELQKEMGGQEQRQRERDELQRKWEGAQKKGKGTSMMYLMVAWE